ncbi:hypothetical protein JL720_2600 [Aureococcus anophagefferens]|nr:hypothetical protein JL720_2600 [Aureococcus anophagefferens]
MRAPKLEGAAPAAKALAENLILWIQDPFQAKTIKAEKEAKALQADNEDLRSKNQDLRERLAAVEANLELATSSLAAKAKKFVTNLFFKESPTAKEAAPVPEDKDPRAQNKDLRAENEDLRERLAAAEASLELATSAESPAKAFVKRLWFKEPSNASEVEALREQLAAAEARAAAELAAAEARAAAAEASLAASESRAVAAESRASVAKAGLAASTTLVKESAQEIEDLRERNAALEEDVVALHASSSFEDSTAKGAVQPRRLQSASGSAPIFGKCYDPAALTSFGYNQITGSIPPEIGQLAALTGLNSNKITGSIPTEIGQLTKLEWLDNNKITGTIPPEIGQLTKLDYLRVLPASPTPGAPRDRPSASLENNNKISGTFPPELCGVATCQANAGNDLVAPCGSTGCCDLGVGAACTVTTPKPTLLLTTPKPTTPETTPEPTAKPTAPEPTTPATTPASTVKSCADEDDESDYRGTISETKTGATCQKWTAQSPHSHVVTPEARPDKGLGDHNYCRNPSTNQPHAWC